LHAARDWPCTWTEIKRCGDVDEHEEMGYGEEVGAEDKYHQVVKLRLTGSSKILVQ